LIEYTPTAARQLADLRRHYEAHDRLESARNLAASVREAAARIESNPTAGIAAPRPYPQLARLGTAWTHAGRYWVSYRLTTPPVITGIFYDAADIPHRVSNPASED
jgi:plasmid stabilization system protein ParE